MEMEMEFKSTGGANSEHERQMRVGGSSGGCVIEF